VTDHPTEDELGRFLAARLDPAGKQRVVRHLLAGCGVCVRRIAALQAPGILLQARAPETALEQAAQDDDERKLERSLKALSESPGDVGAQPKEPLQGRRWIEDLLRRSFSLRYSDAKGMERLAFQAVKAAESLRAEEYSSPTRCDLQALAWAELANSFKVNEEYPQAEAAFRRARDLLRRGSSDLALLAHLSELEASLRVHQRRLPLALELLSGSHWLYLKLGDLHRAGRVLMSKALPFYFEGNFQQSGLLYQQGLSLLDPERDPEMVLWGQQCLVTSYVRSGEYRKAGELLLKSNLRESFADNPIILLRIRWTEGILLAGLGKSSSAANALREVRTQFLERELPYNAAMVGLDLLPLGLQQGKFRETRETAKQAYATFRDLKIHQEAARAKPYLG
jgi:tetratricopeptide (TPR) repeat protein